MISVRPSVIEDSPNLKRWLSDAGVLRWFPMTDQREIEDSARIWMNYIRLGACFTAEVEGTPVGMGILYIQPYQKIAHQCLFAVIVDAEYRGKGVGTQLLETMIHEAKHRFKIELLHLEVYDGNPAQRLYERMGFRVYGRHPRFIKLENEYVDKICMQRSL